MRSVSVLQLGDGVCVVVIDDQAVIGESSISGFSVGRMLSLSRCRRVVGVPVQDDLDSSQLLRQLGCEGKLVTGFWPSDLVVTAERGRRGRPLYEG
jgi:hypothetical protein